MTKFGYTVLEPDHKKYQTGTIFFEYEQLEYPLLKRIGFVVNNQNFFMNMGIGRNRTIITAWIFQKESTLLAISAQERDMLLTLVDDVIDNFTLKKSIINILNAIRPQSEIYLKLHDKELSVEEKKQLKKEFRARNELILRHNDSYAASIKQKNIKQNQKELLENGN